MTRIASKRKPLLVLLCMLALVVGLAACGGDDDDSSSANTSASTNSSAGAATSEGAKVAVTIEGFKFDVSPVTAGASFQVENKDSTEHTFTADDGTFDVDVPAGDTVTVDALDAGSYEVHCEIHTSMTGTLEVS
jgi:plastocyanin